MKSFIFLQTHWHCWTFPGVWFSFHQQEVYCWLVKRLSLQLKTVSSAWLVPINGLFWLFLLTLFPSVLSREVGWLQEDGWTCRNTKARSWCKTAAWRSSVSMWPTRLPMLWKQQRGSVSSQRHVHAPQSHEVYQFSPLGFTQAKLEKINHLLVNSRLIKVLGGQFDSSHLRVKKGIYWSEVTPLPAGGHHLFEVWLGQQKHPSSTLQCTTLVDVEKLLRGLLGRFRVAVFCLHRNWS